jgi:hypothetical protein
LPVGDAYEDEEVTPLAPDPEEEEPPMLPPYGHDVNPRCCSYPLRMLSACLDAAFLFLPSVVERWHGVSFEHGTGGALGHGTGPWDAITGVVKRGIVDDYSENFVDIDMNARNHAVDGWMVERETQSMYWEQPSDAFEASMRSMYRRASRSRDA